MSDSKKKVTTLDPNIDGPFVWETKDTVGNTVVLTPSSLDRHLGRPEHILERGKEIIEYTKTEMFWDVSDETMKYVRISLTEEPMRLEVAVVNTQTDPWSLRTAFQARKLGVHWRVGDVDEQ